MAKHREGAVVYAAQDAQKSQDDFWLELDHRCLDKGLRPGALALSHFAGVNAQTMSNYRNGKREMQIGALRNLVKALKPDLVIVARFLGYTDCEIRRFREVTTK